MRGDLVIGVVEAVALPRASNRTRSHAGTDVLCPPRSPAAGLTGPCRDGLASPGSVIRLLISTLRATGAA
jgi:hypothetical protein